MVVLALGMFVLLGFVVPTLLLSNIQGNWSSNFVIMYLIVLWCVGRLSYTGIKGRRRLTLMLFYVFIYVFMGVQPLLSIWSNVFPHSEFMFTSQMITFSLILLILGIVGFETGYYRFKKPYAICINSISNTKRKIARPLIVNYLWGLSFLTTIIFGLFIVRYGPDAFLGIRGGGFTISEYSGPERSSTENQLAIFGLRGLSSSLLFITLYLRKVRSYLPTNINGSRTGLLLGYLIFINILISSPLNAPRLWSGAVLLTSLFISVKWSGSRSFIVWSSIGCLGMLLLFAGLDPRLIFAKQLVNGGEVTLTNTLREVALSIQNLPRDYNFDAFQMMFYTTVYTSKIGFSFGEQLLLPAFFWIPRTLWPGKPIGSPDLVAEYAGFDSLNVSAPLWSEGYINFGIFGVFLFLFLFGYFARAADTVLTDLTLRPAFSTIISAFFAANTFILLRGDLTSGTMYVQMIAGFTMLFLILVRSQIQES